MKEGNGTIYKKIQGNSEKVISQLKQSTRLSNIKISTSETLNNKYCVHMELLLLGYSILNKTRMGSAENSRISEQKFIERKEKLQVTKEPRKLLGGEQDTENGQHFQETKSVLVAECGVNVDVSQDSQETKFALIDDCDAVVASISATIKPETCIQFASETLKQQPCRASDELDSHTLSWNESKSFNISNIERSSTHMQPTSQYCNQKNKTQSRKKTIKKYLLKKKTTSNSSKELSKDHLDIKQKKKKMNIIFEDDDDVSIGENEPNESNIVHEEKFEDWIGTDNLKPRLKRKGKVGTKVKKIKLASKSMINSLEELKKEKRQARKKENETASHQNKAVLITQKERETFKEFFESIRDDLYAKSGKTKTVIPQKINNSRNWGSRVFVGTVEKPVVGASFYYKSRSPLM